MSWTVVAAFAYLFLGLELGVRRELMLGPTGVAPGFLIPFIVFVALSAPHRAALWLALVLGAAVDLTLSIPTADGVGVVTIVGPNALGCLAAAYFVLTLRGVVVRRNPITVVALSAIAYLLCQIVVVSLLSFRSLYDHSFPWRPAAELGRRALSALYTGASAFVTAIVLLPFVRLFGFREPTGRGAMRRF